MSKKKKKVENKRQTLAQRRCSLGILELTARSTGMSIMGFMTEEHADLTQKFLDTQNKRKRNYPNDGS